MADRLPAVPGILDEHRHSRRSGGAEPTAGGQIDRVQTTRLWKVGSVPVRRPADGLRKAAHHRCPRGVRVSEELLPPRLIGGLNYEMAISDSLGGEVKQHGERSGGCRKGKDS